MEEQIEKCVIVVDESLPVGLIANTAAILGITLGKRFPETVGVDVVDQTGRMHPGIIEFPVPILKGSGELLRVLRQKLYGADFSQVYTVDFSDVAQSCKTYQEFIDKLGAIAEEELRYFGLALCGPKKQINKLTGNLPLLR